ncbi:MAG: ABC transporter permease [Gemmatimonadota bacterium]
MPEPSRQVDGPIQHAGSNAALRWLTDMRQDLRFAARNLRRSPSFALVTALTIAIGVAASTTVFSVMNGLLFRALEVSSPERMFALQERRDGNVSTDNGYSALPYERIRAYTEATRSIVSGVAAYRYDSHALRIGEQTIAVYGPRTTGNYFNLLGLVPAAGRFYSTDTEAVLVLGYSLWQQRFGGDHSVIGQQVSLNSRPFTIAGIAPAGFTGTIVGFDTEVFVPVFANQRPDDDRDPWLFPIARLQPGVELTAANAAFDATAKRIPPESGNVNVFGASLDPIATGMSGQWRGPIGQFFGMILGTSVLVLLIAAANIAGMLLARAVARRREIAIRLAMGAGRGRLVRQLMAETLLVFVVGALGGIALTLFTTRLIANIPLPVAGRVAFDFAPDWRVLVFALATALVTGVLFGLAPAIKASRTGLVVSLKAGLGATDPQSTRGRNVFVAAQVAASVVLLVAAGLFVRSLQQGLAVDPGFDPDGVVIAQINVDPHGYNEERGRVFYRQLIERVRSLPGVEGAGLARIVPLGGSGMGNDVEAIEPGKPEGTKRSALFNVVDPGYFTTMRVPIIAGRALNESDVAGATIAAVINQTMATALWPNQSAIGKRFKQSESEYEVVGVAGDGKYLQITESATPFVYHAFAQRYDGRMTLHVRARGNAAETLRQVHEQVRALDPNVAIERESPLPATIGITLLPQRFGATLIGVFGLIGLLLASIGVYGVLAFQVAQRTREIGIRLALGSTGRGVRGMVVGQGARLALIGGAIGLLVAALTTRFLQNFLFGVSTLVLMTFVAVPLILLVVALIASYIPARRATNVTPLEALRSD